VAGGGRRDDGAVVTFDGVAEQYDAGRPAHPGALFESFGELGGLRVLDAGAGTGIATRQLQERGARVVAADLGPGVLRLAVRRTPDLAAVVADAAALPLRDASFDLVCFAQAWHWVEPTLGCREVRRVLRDGGRWATWWSHARADGEDWYEAHWSLVEAACATRSRGYRDIDWGPTMTVGALFRVDERITLRWLRTTTVEGWLLDQSSHSYVAALAEPERERLLRRLEDLVRRRFPDGRMEIPYSTSLWIAHPA
jgi:SAM-dependent methyltransferase